MGLKIMRWKYIPLALLPAVELALLVAVVAVVDTERVLVSLAPVQHDAVCLLAVPPGERLAAGVLLVSVSPQPKL